MGGLFDADRIVNREGIPEFFVHGPRFIEHMPGDTVRMTFCRDQQPFTRQLSVPVVILNLPLGCMIWNASATHQWVFDRGLLRKTAPVGPAALRPRRELMM